MQRLHAPLFDRAGVACYVKRDDLIDPLLGGNKWRKLKYCLIDARRKGQRALLGFGGAYSNHLYALAAAGRRFGFTTIGMVRGEAHEPLNPTLEAARRMGMQLAYLDRDRYRHKDDPAFLEELHTRFGDFYPIAEGGRSRFALRGVMEMMDEIDIPFDHFCVACGTGTTLAGVRAALNSRQQAHGFVVLRGARGLQANIDSLLAEAGLVAQGTCHLHHDYHFGGYARTQESLWDFIAEFYRSHTIELDAVYTGKLFYGVLDCIRHGRFERGSRIIVLHSGGLQGNRGFTKKIQGVTAGVSPSSISLLP